MWRSLFLALGVYSCILGVEALALEKAVIQRPGKGDSPSYQPRDVVPPEWVPWSLMAGGSVVVLYSFTIPKRVGG